ncbi:MAG: DEAD/DEAH box helicase family protein [Steroidobacteraceae bacterium]
MTPLRLYQERALEALRGSYGTGHRAPLLVLPTAAGKTIVFAHVASSARGKSRRVLVVAHRHELIRQAAEKLELAGVPHGIIAVGRAEDTTELVQVGSVQTLALRLQRLPPFDLIVLDEAHHATAAQWRKLREAQPSARILGVTATPERLDGRGLGEMFDDLVVGASVIELTDAGYLAPARVFAPGEPPPLASVRTQAGDFVAGELAAVMGRIGITGNAADHYARHAAGLPAIAFCITVAHAESVAAAFCEAGWRAVCVQGATPAAERDAAIAGLATGAVQVLTSCDLISEGLDVPALGAVILLRPTKSLGLHLQQIGRGLRPAPGKQHLIVLDHAGNTRRLGFIDDERQWSLDGRAKGAMRPPPMRHCPECDMVHAPAPACPDCGFVYPGVPRIVIAQPGELTELQRLRDAPLRTLLTGHDRIELLEAIRRAKGYKRGWVRHVLREQAERVGS